MGDRILKVNGIDVTKATHQEAVMELLRPGEQIVLTIQHDPLPESYQVNNTIFNVTPLLNSCLDAYKAISLQIKYNFMCARARARAHTHTHTHARAHTVIYYKIINILLSL